jgi:hypothetical protein
MRLFSQAAMAGEVSVFASDTTDLTLDASGYSTTADASFVYVPDLALSRRRYQDKQWCRSWQRPPSGRPSSGPFR